MTKEQKWYSTAELQQSVALSLQQLNSQQRSFYDTVLAAVEEDSKTDCRQEARVFVLHSSGGTGKSFLNELLLDTLRSRHEVAIAASSSGVSALLLQGGTTAHSRYGIPVTQVPEECICPMKYQSNAAKVINSAKLHIWDEAPMAKRSTAPRPAQEPSRRGMARGGRVWSSYLHH
jgi:hypothetical protein